MINKLNATERRARGYWFVDGLAEIGGGILLMILGVPYLVWSLAPHGSRLAQVISKGRDIILLAGIVVLFIVIREIKQLSTFPRSGFIDERRPRGKQVLNVILLIFGFMILFPFLLIAGLRLIPSFAICFLDTMLFFPTILGLFFMVGLVMWGRSTGIKRFYVLAGVSAVASLGLGIASFIRLLEQPFDISYFPPLTFNAQMPAEAASTLGSLFNFLTIEVGIFFAIFGLALLISGLIVRRRYLKENPLSSPVEQEAGK